MWQYVMQDIGDKLRFLPVATVAGAGLYLVCYLIFCRKANLRNRLPVKILFLIYLLMLIQLTLLEREPGSRTDINLMLFGTLGDARANAYVLENLLLFIPYGTMLPLIWGRAGNGLLCVLMGGLTSVGIELIQMVTQRGYFQVDDMAVNTLGMLCGYWVYRAIKWMGREKAA